MIDQKPPKIWGAFLFAASKKEPIRKIRIGSFLAYVDETVLLFDIINPIVSISIIDKNTAADNLKPNVTLCHDGTDQPAIRVVNCAFL